MKKQTKMPSILLAFSIILAGIAFAFTGGYYLGKDKPNVPAADVPVAGNDDGGFVPGGDTDAGMPDPDGDLPEPGDMPGGHYEIVQGDNYGLTDISWVPLASQKEEPMDSDLQESLSHSKTASQFIGVGGTNDYVQQTLGTVKVGTYKNYSVVDQRVLVGEGLGYSLIDLVALVRPANQTTGPKFVLLTNYSEVRADGDEFMDRTFAYSELVGLYDVFMANTVAEFDFGKSTMTFTLSSGGKATANPYRISDRRALSQATISTIQAKYPLVGTDENGRIFRLTENSDEPLIDHDRELFVSGKNSLFIVRKDGAIVWSGITLPFWPDTADGGSYYAVPLVTLNGVVNTDTYLKGAVGGCGLMSPAHVVDPKDIPGMAVIGYVTGDSSQKIYGANYADAYFDYQYTYWQYQHKNGTREEFSRVVPAFYYQDALGRWLAFENSATIAAGECGKPVIYLYPEKTTDLTVKLAPQGGFTKSEPAYGTGWNVTASPNGEIVNHADDKTYPYLFWEGRGGIYESPRKYWVVAKADVKDFLTGTLAKLGMNEKETADFMEFWYPRMQSAPYYQIGFYGNSVMDTLAPLSISEKPDTIIRILMDYQELSAPAKSNPPTLPKTPERKGFTVLEWGGVLR